MAITYTGPESGVGSAYAWTSDTWSVGSGKVVISEATPNSSVSCDMNFGEGNDAKAKFIIVPEGAKSKVTWTFDSDSHGNLFSRWMGMCMDNFLGGQYEKGLASMSGAAQKIVLGRVDHIEEYLCHGANALGIRSTINASDIPATLAKSYGAIMQYMSTKNIKMDGYPSAIYHTWDGKTTDMEAMIPIAKADVGNANIKPILLPKGPMIIAHYYGPYEGSEAAHEACSKWLVSHGKTQAYPPFEEYVTDPGTEKDPTKWLTKVNYYVK
ncbi:MAG: GyrI-like domain-containing protein [Candidatus Kapabacteria bacterium]|nr:GyrI-like domain-containing protein [Candidatus Kapabacteria bacterium]